MKDLYDIILADDNTSDAELAIRALRKSFTSLKILHVEDGAELLEYMFASGRFSGRNIQHQPSMILMDLKMPRLSGLEALQQIKQNPQTKNTPVILLTSSEEANDIDAGYNMGANSYVVKPLEYDNYLNAITEIGRYWLTINQCCS